MSWTKNHMNPTGTIGLHHSARVLGCKEEEVLGFAKEGLILLTSWCFEAVQSAGNDLSGVCWSFDRQSVEALWPRLQNQGLSRTMVEISEMHKGISEIKEKVRTGFDELGSRMERLEGAISDCFEVLDKNLNNKGKME